MRLKCGSMRLISSDRVQIQRSAIMNVKETFLRAIVSQSMVFTSNGSTIIFVRISFLPSLFPLPPRGHDSDTPLIGVILPITLASASSSFLLVPIFTSIPSLPPHCIVVLKSLSFSLRSPLFVFCDPRMVLLLLLCDDTGARRKEEGGTIVDERL